MKKIDLEGKFNN